MPAPHHDETFQVLAKSRQISKQRLDELYAHAEKKLVDIEETLDANLFVATAFKDHTGKVIASRCVYVPDGTFVSLNVIDNKRQMTTGVIWSFESADAIRQTHGTKIY
jgi:hypothetical protein